nr:hypothetical protein [Tanacetum cinerariifolium]
MLAPGNYVQWKSRIKRYIDTKPNHELIHYFLENPPYELGWKDKRVPDSDGNLTTITERDGESLESYYSRFYKMMNELIRNAQINRNAGYESQRIGNVAGARETVGSSMVQKSGIQCYNFKEFGHVAREC